MYTFLRMTYSYMNYSFRFIYKSDMLFGQTVITVLYTFVFKKERGAKYVAP